MSQSQTHDHDDHSGHDHGHGGHHHGHHHHHHGDPQEAGPFPWRRMGWAVLLVAFAIAAASLVQVRSGEATVITRFGNPAR
ncbi:MAG TPA: protease modulator HflC, partial [Pseudomonas sp.]|nr:protease modulator HflC [Pseudomonas sp.]